MNGDTPAYVTEDGVTLSEGAEAYNYYSMKRGVIGPASGGFNDWFEFLHDDGTTALLNGQRICTIAFAKRRGFKGA